jgi:MFS family permease
MTREKLAILAIIAVVLIGHMGIALPYPILAPMFLSDGAPFAVPAGWLETIPPLYLFAVLMAIYPLGTLLGSLILGDFSDRLGRRIVILVTLLLAAAMNLLAAYAIVAEHYLLLCAARFLTGFCEGNIAVARAIVADLDLGEKKTVTFGYLNSAGYAGYLTGPLIGAAFALWDFSLPFTVAAVLTLLSAAICARFLPETGQRSTESMYSDEGRQPKAGSPVKLMKQPFIKRMLAVQFLITFAINLYHEYFPVLMVEKWAATPLNIGLATMVATTTMILVSVLGLRHIVPHLSLGRLYGLSMAGLGIALVAFTLPDRLWLLYGVFIVFGVALAIFNSSSTSYLSDVYANLPQGRLMGTFASMFFLSNIAAALLGGSVARISVDFPMYLGTGLALLAAVLFIHPARHFYRLSRERRELALECRRPIWVYHRIL